MLLWDQIKWSYNQGALEIKGCKIKTTVVLYKLHCACCYKDHWDQIGNK